MTTERNGDSLWYVCSPIVTANGSKWSITARRPAGTVVNAASLRHRHVARGASPRYRSATAASCSIGPAASGERGELRELGVCPGERHRRACGVARLEESIGDRRAVPHLFGQQARRAGHRDHGRQIRRRVGTGLRRVVAPLAGEERPGSAGTGAVERAAVVVLAVTVAVVPAIRDARRQLDRQQLVDQGDGVDDARIERLAEPEPHEREEVERDELLGCDVPPDPVAHVDAAALAVRRRGRAETYVVAGDVARPSQSSPPST